MKNLNKSLLAQIFAVGLLGMGVTACDNANQAPETEEPVESSTIDAENNPDTTVTDSDMGAAGEDHDMTTMDHDMNTMEDNGMGENDMENHDMAKPESDMTNLDPNAPETELDTDVMDQDQVLSGTEEEEHVSTY